MVEEEGLGAESCGLRLWRECQEHQGSDDVVGGGASEMIWNGTGAVTGTGAGTGAGTGTGAVTSAGKNKFSHAHAIQQ